MQRKNFIGYRDRVLLHLLNFEKDVYENIHNGVVDGNYSDFLIHLTQEGIADSVGTKQSTIYKELQNLRLPTLDGEEPLIHVIEKVRIPGKERVCAIYYLTQYGHDLAAQKTTYLEKKNLEVFGLDGPGAQMVTISDLVNRITSEGIEANFSRALLRIAAITSKEGVIQWADVKTPPVDIIKEEQIKEEKPKKIKPSKPEIENPYFNRIAIKDPKYFFGRDEEVRYIMSLLRNTQSCSIVGSRRIGKSSLINYISNPELLQKHGLNSNDYIFVSVDLEGLGDLTQSEFFTMIIEEIRNGITSGELRKQLEELIIKENIRFLDLKNVCRDITDLNKSVVLLFDEFELITKNKNLDFNFFSGLRNLANAYNVAYITASHVPLLDLTFSKETLGSPFFNFFTQIDLSLMDEEAVDELITGPSQEYDVSFPENIIEFIKNTAGFHPFFIQMLTFHIFNWIKENGSISDSDLPEITKRFHDEALPHFRYFWNHLSGSEQGAIQKLSIGGPRGAHAVSQPVAHELTRKGLIINVDDGYRIFSNAFSEFITNLEGISLEEPGITLEHGAGAVGVIKPKSSKKISIDWGNNYYVDEDHPKVSVEFFNELTNRGISGLFITRTPPEKAEEQWKLSNSNIIWLCSRTGKNYLTPALEKISHTIFEFVKKNKHSVVFLDGVEYIINNNDFLKTLTLMDNIKEMVALHNAVLIIPMSSSIFSKKEMALLGKNSAEISQDVDLDFLKVDE